MSLRPLVISHRTNMGTMPENTLEGIAAALSEGADGVEIDVRATRDGIPVLMHDDSLARTLGDTRAVKDVTLADLRDPRLYGRDGAQRPRVPTLGEALTVLDGRAILVIEVKESGLDTAVAEAVRSAGAAEWCWIWSFDPAVSASCRAALPEVPASLTISSGSLARYGVEEDAVALSVRLGLSGLAMHHGLADLAIVERARRRGLAVYTWTVDEPEDIARVRDAGVDAICSDFPPRVWEAIGAP